MRLHDFPPPLSGMLLSLLGKLPNIPIGNHFEYTSSTNTMKRLLTGEQRVAMRQGSSC